MPVPNRVGHGASAPASSSVSGPAPSAAEISRVFAVETSKDVYHITQTGVIECAFAHVHCNAALIYVCGGDSAGVLQNMAGDTYLGRTPKHLTEIRSVGDENLPFLIAETSLSQQQSARTYVKGTAGDQLILIYR